MLLTVVEAELPWAGSINRPPLSVGSPSSLAARFVGKCGKVTLGLAIPLQAGDRALPSTPHLLQGGLVVGATGRGGFLEMVVLRQMTSFASLP